MRAAAIAVSVGVVFAAPAAAAAQDPQVIRSDGGGQDRARAITTDGAGNSYVAGRSESTAGGSSFAVVKLGPDGTRRFTARYDGSRGGFRGTANAVAVDAAGNVYAAGSVENPSLFFEDFLVVKFAPDGTQRWAHRFDGPANDSDIADAVAVDAVGNVYVTGTSGGDWSTQSLTPDGTLRWERRLSGPGRTFDVAKDLALLPDGNIVVSGDLQNTSDETADDAETVAYDADGDIVWRARFSDGATSDEKVSDLDVDAAGRIVVTGSTRPSRFAASTPFTLRFDRTGTLLQTIRDAGGSSVEVAPGGGFHLAGSFDQASLSTVARFDAAGNRVWSTPLNADPGEPLSRPRVAVDSTGAVTVAATVDGVTSYQTIRFDADGREVFRHRFDGRDDAALRDEVAGIAVDANNATLVTGTSENGIGGDEGFITDIVTLKFAAGAAPALFAPSRLEAAALSRSQIQLRWQDNAGTEDGFRIERCADVAAGLACTDFAAVATVGRDATGFTDSRLTRDTTYRYRVRAFNAGGSSAASNVATATTRRR